MYRDLAVQHDFLIVPEPGSEHLDVPAQFGEPPRLLPGDRFNAAHMRRPVVGDDRHAPAHGLPLPLRGALSSSAWAGRTTGAAPVDADAA